LSSTDGPANSAKLLIRSQRSGRAQGFVGGAFRKLLGKSRYRWMKALGNRSVATKSGPRTGMIGLSAPDGGMLVAWTKNNQLGWQLYDARGQPAGPAGSARTSGNGVGGVVDKEGHFIRFR
jgi:hypothetical protein